METGRGCVEEGRRISELFNSSRVAGAAQHNSQRCRWRVDYRRAPFCRRRRFGSR